MESAEESSKIGFFDLQHWNLPNAITAIVEIFGIAAIIYIFYVVIKKKLEEEAGIHYSSGTHFPTGGELYDNFGFEKWKKLSIWPRICFNDDVLKQLIISIVHFRKP